MKFIRQINYKMFVWTLALISGLITTNLHAENIILKSLIVNPSRTVSQNVPFKVYLPKEIVPANIIDPSGCKIDFDYQSGKYFAHNDFKLKPGESKKIEIILEDVWKIPDDEIASYKEKSREMLKQLEGTAGYDRSSFFKNNLDSALSRIDQLSKNKSLSPADYMKQYRDVMELLAAVKADLAAQKSVQKEAEKEKELVSNRMALEIVIAIIISLTLLCSVFFYIWYTKIREPANTAAVNAMNQVSAQPPEAEQKVSRSEKKVDLSDLESLLKNK